MFAETQDLAVRLSLKDGLSGPLRGTVRDLRGIDRATARTQASLGKFGRNVQIGALAAAGGLLATVKAASDYESAFAGVRKTVDATEPQLQELSKAFRDLSKQIPISAAELASLGEVGGALGIPIEQMEEFVRVTALLGVTTDLTAEDAATSLGILSNVLHLTGDEYNNFASSLVALGNAGASTESQIIAIAERAGAAGELVGVSTEKILGFSSAVASLGIEPEAGGTALQKFFIDTAKFIAEGGEELEIFAKVSGTSAKQIKKNFDKDAGGALQRFLANLGKLDQGEQLRVLEGLGFNDARITRTLLGLANNTELVSEQQKIANDAYKEGAALTKEAEQRFKTFDSQLQITKNVLTDVGITIGSKLLPKLTPLLQNLNKFVTDHQGDIEKFGTDLAGGFERFADAVGKTDWTPFIDGLKLSAELAKDAFDAFNALPDDFKKLILVGAGVNKITGGLITSVGKDVAGALGAQFLSRGSSPANPLWVQSVGGVGGGVGGPGGGGGILGKVGALAAAAALPVAIVSIAEPVKNQLFPDLITPDKFLPPEPAGGAKPFWELIGGGGGGVRVPESPRLLAKMGEFATRQNITNERLDSIRGYTQSQMNTATTMLASNERIEAITAQKAEQVKAQLAAGDTRTEIALASAATRTVAASGLIKTAVTQVNAGVHATTVAARHAGQQTAAAIRDKDLSVKVTVPISIRNYNAVTKQVNSLYRVAS